MPTLYAHPFSSYSWKALIALYENATPFTYKVIGPDDPDAVADWSQRWPIRKFPVLVDGDETIVEASIIIEHLDLHYPGAVRLVPAGAAEALKARELDRIFDNYIMTPMQKIVADKLRPEADRDAYGVAEARRTLDTAYAWLDGALAGRTWAAGEAFTIADCAGAPSLFYTDWAHPIPAAHRHLKAYRQRVLARPSVVRAVDEARPYRHYFPRGAPDRD